ncbi:DUF6358 family protein [Mucilaginibacter sp. PAMB04168]|uniref:DUF6358 family protein n=1 Tax=Mucilaginibacter sp. PAMB04168 TaxID=3138567 RepID=UPI0031F5F329
MGFKMFLSVVYNIGIFISLYMAYWGFTHQQYIFVAAGILIAALFIFLKIRLLKQVKAMERPVKK